ncbi:hypothetical protein ACOMHN_031977 [Nucella lapillus]
MMTIKSQSEDSYDQGAYQKTGTIKETIRRQRPSRANQKTMTIKSQSEYDDHQGANQKTATIKEPIRRQRHKQIQPTSANQNTVFPLSRSTNSAA